MSGPTRERSTLFRALVGLAALAILLARRELLVGSGALVVLLVLEAFIGGEVYDHPGLQVLHFPLALSLMALAVWLPLRAGRRRDGFDRTLAMGPTHH